MEGLVYPSRLKIPGGILVGTTELRRGMLVEIDYEEDGRTTPRVYVGDYTCYDNIVYLFILPTIGPDHITTLVDSPDYARHIWLVGQLTEEEILTHPDCALRTGEWDTARELRIRETLRQWHEKPHYKMDLLG